MCLLCIKNKMRDRIQKYCQKKDRLGLIKEKMVRLRKKNSGFSFRHLNVHFCLNI